MVRVDIKNKELVGDTWSPTASMRTLKCFLAGATKHKAVFLKLDSRYADYFPEYSNYFGRALRLLKSMYGMTNSGMLFADELKEWLLESGFIKSQCQMSIYYSMHQTKQFLFCLVHTYNR